MAMVIGTNMGAINATRIMDQTQRDMAVSAERLTTGKSINSAADNAAGLAISTGMTSQIKGTDQAVKNANDGISMVQTLDGASEETVAMLQRMRELSVQSLNGTYTDDNRAQMNEEFSALSSEIDRIASTTKFNGQTLMDSAKTVDFHVGWEIADDSISLSTIDMSASGLGVDSDTIATSTGAATALTNIDAALSSMNTARAGFGAVQNRLEHTISNLQNVSENTSAARSRIEDADFAKESAALAKSQVLQQAGMSMMSKANQNVQQVTQLLQ